MNHYLIYSKRSVLAVRAAETKNETLDIFLDSIMESPLGTELCKEFGVENKDEITGEMKEAIVLRGEPVTVEETSPPKIKGCPGVPVPVTIDGQPTREYRVEIAGRRLDPNLSIAVGISDAGFNWGYAGSGPRNLAH